MDQVRVERRQMQAEFLGGPITTQFLPGAVASVGLVASRLMRRPCASIRGFCDPESIDICRTEPRFNETLNMHIPACQSDGFGCGGGSLGCGNTDLNSTICPSGAFVCGQTAGCTGGRECSVGCQ